MVTLLLRFKIRNNGVRPWPKRVGECGRGIGLGMGQDHTAVRVVRCRRSKVATAASIGPGPARVDVPNVGLGDRVRRLQYVAPV